MNILITGATGFIGSHLTKELCKKGYHCRCLVRNINKAKKIFKDYKDIEFVVGNMTDKDVLIDYNKPVDCVINSAALLAKWNSTEEELKSINSEAPTNLIKNLSKNGIKHFIQISSGGVTGPVWGELADENYKCKPASLYEKSKYLGELNVEDYCKEYDIPYTIIRPTFTYGPGDPHKLLLFKISGKGLVITSDGGNSVNFPVYIDDLIQGIILAVRKGGNNQIYIIGGEKPISKKEFLITIANILDKKFIRIDIPQMLVYLIAYIMEFISKIFKIDPIISTSRANMMCKNFGYKINKAKRELNYKPEFSHKRGLENTIAYYKENGVI